jgi:predicted nucleic acid-binding Zn ribbon protein
MADFDSDLEKLGNQFKMPQNTPSAIKNVLDDLVDKFKFKEKFGELSIADAWKNALGDNVARRTQKILVRDRIIFIKVESASLKNELLMNKTIMLQKLNEYVGEVLVDDMIFM